MSSPSRKGPRAVLLDAFGTLVEMEPPAPRLRAELRRRTGAEVSAEGAQAAFRAEIAYYLEHHLEGRDEHSLDALRDRCADVLAGALGPEFQRVDRRAVRAAMLASLRFRAHADAPEALGQLRERGARLVVVSNWDCSLARVLSDADLGSRVDAVVSSAAVGAAKPDPAVFGVALGAVGADAENAVHVGDSLAHDVAGARAAGIRAVLLDRRGEGRPAGVAAIGSLRQLPSLLFGAE